jgi:hypothetical protein
MSLENDIKKNMELAQQVEEFLKNVRPDQRGAIYTMLLIYTAHTLNISKNSLVSMIDQFFDNGCSGHEDECWN